MSIGKIGLISAKGVQLRWNISLAKKSAKSVLLAIAPGFDLLAQIGALVDVAQAGPNGVCVCVWWRRFFASSGSCQHTRSNEHYATILPHCWAFWTCRNAECVEMISVWLWQWHLKHSFVWSRWTISPGGLKFKWLWRVDGTLRTSEETSWVATLEESCWRIISHLDVRCCVYSTYCDRRHLCLRDWNLLHWTVCSVSCMDISLIVSCKETCPGPWLHWCLHEWPHGLKSLYWVVPW